MQSRLILIVAATTVVVATAQAKDQPQLTVEVLKAETVHWTTYLHDNGSAGTTKTKCDDGYGTGDFSCTSTTEGARPASTKEIYHTQVNLLVKMPDGSTAGAQCQLGTWIWSSETSCVQPQLGPYAAKIDKHGLRLLIPIVTGKPEYNKDGTLKKTAKTGTQEVKFSFR